MHSPASQPLVCPQVRLDRPGRHLVSFDNTFSIWRSKHVRFTLRQVPTLAWEAGCHVERLARLQAECATRKARSRELAKEVAQAEEYAAKLTHELAAAQVRSHLPIRLPPSPHELHVSSPRPSAPVISS